MAASAPASVTDPAGTIKMYQDRVAYWTKVLVDGGHPIVERSPDAVMKAFTGLASVDLNPFVEKYEAEMLPKFLGK